MKVAALQMVSATTWEANLQSAYALLADAAQQGAELVVLPEYFCLLGRRDTDKLALAENVGSGPIQQFLADAAREFKLWIVGGTLPLKASGSSLDRVFNTMLVFSPTGDSVARYDKIHLFRFDNGQEAFDESRVLQRGSQPTRFELPSCDGHIWRVGLSICYDLRFPELYRQYAAEGADVLLVPSAFTYTTGQAHWEVLLRARAIENQAFVVAAAQGGVHENGRRTWGHTLVANPWGEVMGQLPEGPGVVLQDLAMDLITACRTKLPALTHRVL
jgi:deaminated glutathione amidase